ncbi:MAG: hypothetical protein KC616_16560 [Myxococcales bacterium]|nr:hypothetical protein [Myxococcales bacterium]
MLRLSREAGGADDASGGSLLVYGAGRNQLPVLDAARRAGWRVVAVDRDAFAPGASLADHFVCESLREHDAILRELVDERLAGVVARVTDRIALDSSSRLARARGLVAPCEALLDASTSKRALARHCADHGLPTPRRFESADAVDWGREAVCLRPDVTIRGKDGIRRIERGDDWSRAWRAAASASANGRVDVSEWVDGIDVSLLVHLDAGRATRLALWDEWVALDEGGAIHGVGCGTPSVFEMDPSGIDDVVERLGRAFPESRTLVALSLRVDRSGRAFVIEIHVGVGGDAIADRLLPSAWPGYDAFAQLVSVQTGRAASIAAGRPRPRALLRDGEDWRLVAARDGEALRALARATVRDGWTMPFGLRAGGAA